MTVWYKLHAPLQNQVVKVKNDADLIRDFIKVSDCFKHLYGDKLLVDDKNGRNICDKTIEEVHVICEKKFDLEFVKREAEFVLDQLNTLINVKESKLLYQGLLSPGTLMFNF